MANQMLSQRINNSITLDFISCMIPHHQAAIYMCENLLNYTNYEPLIRIAREIIKMQSRGIKQMEEIAKTTSYICNNNRDVKSYMYEYFQITRRMIYRMKNSIRSSNINLNFVDEMIPHHEGAIEMCNNLLKYNIDPRLKSVAEEIIREQSQGVRELEQIKECLCRCNN